MRQKLIWRFLRIFLILVHCFCLRTEAANFLSPPPNWTLKFSQENIRVWLGKEPYPQGLVHSVHYGKFNTSDFLKLESERVKISLAALRNATYYFLDFGDMSIQKYAIGKLDDGAVIVLLEGMYSGVSGQQTYFSEHIIIAANRINDIVVSDPFSVERARESLNNVFRKQSPRSPSNETEKLEGKVCLECLSNDTDGFLSSFKKIDKAVEFAKSQDRKQYCSEVKPEYKSKIIQIFGEDEIKSWDDQFSFSIENVFRLKTPLTCLASLPVGFVRGIYEPIEWLVKTGVGLSVKGVTNIPELFKSKTWEAALQNIQGLPESVKKIYQSGINSWPVVLESVKNPIKMGEKITASLAKIINGFLVQKIPQFMCLSREARAQMICDSIGYLAGSLVDVFKIFQLLRIGKITEVTDKIRGLLNNVSGKYWSPEVAAAKDAVSTEGKSKAITLKNGAVVDTAKLDAEMGAKETGASFTSALKSEIKHIEEKKTPSITSAEQKPLKSPAKPNLTSNFFVEKFSLYPTKDKKTLLKAIEDTYKKGSPQEVVELDKLLKALSDTGEKTLAKAKAKLKDSDSKQLNLLCPVRVTQ